MVDDFQAIVAKLRESYKNLNVENVGVFGQGLGWVKKFTFAIIPLSSAHVALRLMNQADSVDVSLNCTLLLSPITNIEQSG